MADREKWLSLKQVHERLADMNVDIQTIRTWGDQGRFGEVKRTLGGHRRYNPAAVNDALRTWQSGHVPDSPTDPPDDTGTSAGG